MRSAFIYIKCDLHLFDKSATASICEKYTVCRGLNASRPASIFLEMESRAPITWCTLYTKELSPPAAANQNEHSCESASNTQRHVAHFFIEPLFFYRSWVKVQALALVYSNPASSLYIKPATAARADI